MRSFAGNFAGRAQHAVQRREGLAAHVAVGRQEIGNGAQRRLLIDQQHVVLLAHERLELGQRQSRLVVLDWSAGREWPPARARRHGRAPCRRKAGRGRGTRASRRSRCATSVRRCGTAAARDAAGSFPLSAAAAHRSGRCRRRPAARASRRSTGTFARLSDSVMSRQASRLATICLEIAFPAAPGTGCPR